MEPALFYGVQGLAVDVGSSALRADLAEITFTPSERQYLLSDDRQDCASDLGTDPSEGRALQEYVRDQCVLLGDYARAVRAEGRVLPAGDDIEAIYAEIEGDAYVAPKRCSTGELSRLHGVLDLYQCLESIRDLVRMYPELAAAARRESWLERLDLLSDGVEALLTVGAEGA